MLMWQLMLAPAALSLGGFDMPRAACMIAPCVIVVQCCGFRDSLLSCSISLFATCKLAGLFLMCMLLCALHLCIFLDLVTR